LGVLFLLDTTGVPGASFSNTWPLLLVLIGVVKVFQHNAPTEGHINPGAQPPASTSGPSPLTSGDIAPNRDGQVNNA
jgi:Domain of unknown function (DUF5668)